MFLIVVFFEDSRYNFINSVAKRYCDGSVGCVYIIIGDFLSVPYCRNANNAYFCSFYVDKICVHAMQDQLRDACIYRWSEISRYQQK